VFVDRLVITLIHLRHDLPHSVLGLLSRPGPTARATASSERGGDERTLSLVLGSSRGD
jgi:hypothetical protein